MANPRGVPPGAQPNIGQLMKQAQQLQQSALGPLAGAAGGLPGLGV